MEVLLDTNFIISCVRKNIDFIFELEGMGFKVILPNEVFEEMKDLKKRPGTSHDDRNAIKVAFEMFERQKIKKATIGSGKVDDMLIKKGASGYYIATLDAGIKGKVPNRVIINDAAKRVEVERD